MAKFARDVDSFYLEDCRSVQDATGQITRKAENVLASLRRCSTSADVFRIRSMVDSAVDLSGHTQTVLKRLSQYESRSAAEAAGRKQQHRQLSERFAHSCRALEDAAREFMKHQELCEQQAGDRRRLEDIEAPPSISNPYHELDSAVGSAEGDAAAGHAEVTRQAILEEACREMEIREKTEDMRRVERSVLSLAEMCSEMQQAASAQQDAIDTIESQMALAADYTVAANVELMTATKRSERWFAVQSCALVALVLFILINLWLYWPF
mmetsp:Transcript_627/g.987  ORF Transcript_627/g.987 Transcript_627/m.987 type:complete len:267 (-) Transcript_627:101-901(-)